MAGLRVIAGSAKGRRLRMVPGEGTRPIADRVKESLFNILGTDIVGATFLDLFAGTGGVGIEALSRGARRATFVEKDRLALETIKANLATTGLSGKADIVRTDVFAYLGNSPSAQFDFVYIAPPQYFELWSRTLQLIDAQPEWLAPDGWAIVQIHPAESKELELSHLQLVDERRYGSTLLIFYERPGT